MNKGIIPISKKVHVFETPCRRQSILEESHLRVFTRLNDYRILRAGCCGAWSLLPLLCRVFTTATSSQYAKNVWDNRRLAIAQSRKNAIARRLPIAQTQIDCGHRTFALFESRLLDQAVVLSN